MSYYVAFGVPDADEPVDADDLATNTGWAAFQDWAHQLGEDWHHLAYIGEYGEVFSPEGDDHDSLAALESELRRALRDKPNDPSDEVLSVAHRLLVIVEQRPEGAFWLVVTDGTEE